MPRKSSLKRTRTGLPRYLDQEFEEEQRHLSGRVIHVSKSQSFTRHKSTTREMGASTGGVRCLPPRPVLSPEEQEFRRYKANWQAAQADRGQLEAQKVMDRR